MPRVGEDLVTSCGKCKQRTTHVVFAMEGNSVKRVQCKICLSYHNYHPDPEEREAARAAASSAVRRRREGEPTEVTRVGGSDSSPPAPARPPREKAPATTREPAARKSRAKDATPDYEVLWGQAMQGKDPETMIDYRPTASFEEGSLVNHPGFGVGVVTRVAPTPERRMNVIFRDGPKTLVHRYGS